MAREYVERYIAIPEEHVAGKYRRSAKMEGYRDGENFSEVINGQEDAPLNEEWLVRLKRKLHTGHAR